MYALFRNVYDKSPTGDFLSFGLLTSLLQALTQLLQPLTLPPRPPPLVIPEPGPLHLEHLSLDDDPFLDTG